LAIFQKATSEWIQEGTSGYF